MIYAEHDYTDTIADNTPKMMSNIDMSDIWVVQNMAYRAVIHRLWGIADM